MVEIEISVLSRQCLSQRIPTIQKLTREVRGWLRHRNEKGQRIKWMFDIEGARTKLGRSYPTPALPRKRRVA